MYYYPDFCIKKAKHWKSFVIKEFIGLQNIAALITHTRRFGKILRVNKISKEIFYDNEGKSIFTSLHTSESNQKNRSD